MDPGSDLSRCGSGPWVKKFHFTKECRLHPVFQHLALLSTENTANGAPSTNPESEHSHKEQSLPQSIVHIHQKYGRYSKTEIMANDAFYALNEIFEFSAASVDQLLELFEGVRGISQHSDQERLSELLILQAHVDDYKNYVRDTVAIVRSRGSDKWPRVNEIKQREKADHAAAMLEARYDRLLKRCERISEQCSSSINIMMSFQAQNQARQAMEQADKLGELSFLAYIYIPITFAASFYGMNFQELGQQLSIWSFFVMAVALLVVSLIAWFIDVPSVCVRCWGFVKRSGTSQRP